MAVASTLAVALRDRYLIEREVGCGATATVFLARDLRRDRPVALKVLRPELAGALGPERFLREIALTARLDHPNILPVLDSGEAVVGRESCVVNEMPTTHDPRLMTLLWFTMPYAAGQSLRERLVREVQLPVDEAVRIGCQLALALDYAHAHGVLHRDIKPENIMLHEGEALLADYGVALAMQGAADERLTETGLSIGTPQYMSPEQAAGQRELTTRSDLFSLGVVIYELLTGEPPFRGRTPQTVMARIMTERPSGIRTVRDTVPPGLEAAVLRALAKVPADRPASGREFAAALRVGLDTGEMPVGPKGRRRRRALAWSVALSAVVLGLVVSARARHHVAPSTGPPLVLVAPFVSPKGDTAAATIARTLSQAVVDSLAAVGGLRAVTAPADTGGGVDSLLRRSELGLTIGGSVERNGAQLKATGRVNDGTTRTQLYAQAQQAPPVAASVMESDLVERLVRYVRRHVGTEVRRRAVAAETRDSVARDYWSRALPIIDAISAPEARSVPTATADRLAVADSLLGEAIRRDPRWTGPQVARGWAALESGSLYGSEGQRDPRRIAAHRKAIAAADAAIRISPDDAEAHELRGVALVGLWFEAASEQADAIGREAEQELNRAISLDLNVARAWGALGTYYLFVGRFQEAREALAQAQQADAFLLSEPRILRWQYLADLNLERYDDARRTCERGSRWYPLELAFLRCQYTLLGWSASDLPSARRAWQLGLRAEDRATPALRTDEYRINLLMSAAILARAGARDSAKALLRTFVATRRQPVDLDGFASDEAWVRLLVGEQGRAIALLRSFLHNNWAQRGYVMRTPWYRTLHGNPEFVAMTERRP